LGGGVVLLRTEVDRKRYTPTHTNIHMTPHYGPEGHSLFNHPQPHPSKTKHTHTSPSQETAVLLYGAVVAHHYLPPRPAGPPRRLRTEAMPIEEALHRLVALIDPSAASSSTTPPTATAPGANAAAAAQQAGGAAAAAATTTIIPPALPSAAARAQANRAVALELGALRERLRRFRAEVAPLVVAALVRDGGIGGEGGDGKKGEGGKMGEMQQGHAGGSWWGEGGAERPPTPVSVRRAEEGDEDLGSNEGSEGGEMEEGWEEEEEEDWDEDDEVDMEDLEDDEGSEGSGHVGKEACSGLVGCVWMRRSWRIRPFIHPPPHSIKNAKKQTTHTHTHKTQPPPPKQTTTCWGRCSGPSARRARG
jgi:hypothetical protein